MAKSDRNQRRLDSKRSCMRGEGGEITSSRSGAGARVVCVARGCEQPLSPSLCFMRLSWNRTFTCVSPSCRAPATSARTATDLLKRNAFSGSVSSLVTVPASGATLIVWPSRYAEPTGQARVLAGNRPENQINGVTRQRCTRFFRTKLNLNFFKMVFWNIPQNQMTVLLPSLHGLVCVFVCVYVWYY